MIRLGAIAPLLSTIASFLFLVLGAVAVYTMMARMGKKEISNPDVYRKVHRIAGWSFTMLFEGVIISTIGRSVFSLVMACKFN